MGIMSGIMIIFIFSFYKIKFGYTYTDNNEIDIEATDVLQNIELFQGDILGYDRTDEYYNAVANDNQLWTNNVVYYTVDQSLASHEWMINNAINEIMNQTDNCITFKKRVSEPNYVYIFNGSGCSSYVGMKRGRQDLHLGNGCFYLGTIIHELMHSIGFHHEHCRSDRDDYLDIHMENVISGHEHAFDKLNANQNRLLEPFDYESIMIYGEYSFSKNKNKTMIAKNNVTIRDPYLKKAMSAMDVSAIKTLYHCYEQTDSY